MWLVVQDFIACVKTTRKWLPQWCIHKNWQPLGVSVAFCESDGFLESCQIGRPGCRLFAFIAPVAAGMWCVQNAFHWSLPHVGVFLYITLLLYKELTEDIQPLM